MLIILSPAKTLDMKPSNMEVSSIPEFVSKAVSLNAQLKKYSVDELQDFMEISEKLARENRLRYRQFRRDHNIGNSKQAALTFSGDVYRGLQADELSEEDLSFAQDRLRILSGMYGLLRPLDLIQPYRLEMGRPLANKKGDDLYAFWNGLLTKSLNRTIRENGHSALVNLASKEYAKAVDFNKIKVPVIHIDFREEKNGKLRFFSFNAKKARGLMTRFAIKNRLTNPEHLKAFDIEGYLYSADHSDQDHWTFIR